MHSLKENQGQIKSYPDCNKDGTQAFSSNYELQLVEIFNSFSDLTWLEWLKW